MSEEKRVKIRPIIAIVCDEVRMENNGKPFLVGIYLGGINVSGPKVEETDEVYNLPIHLWIPFEATEPGIANFEVKLIMPNPKHQMRAIGKVVVEKIVQATEIVPLTLGPFPLKLWENGNLEILFKHDDEEEFQTLRTIPVTYTPIEPRFGVEEIS